MRVSLACMMAVVLAAPTSGWAQVSGNIGYSAAGAKARAEQKERAKRAFTDQDKPPSATSSFVEANVLMNVKADEFVAVFGLAQEGATPAECRQKMDALVREFTDAIKELKIGDDDIDVDFIAQARIYGFEIAGDIARERLVGFELKQNVSVHYKDRATLDKLMLAASRSKIYDLIKVDYIVRDIKAIQARLVEEAAKIIKEKMARYETLLAIKLQPPGQVYAERYATHYPTGMYDSYTAAEVEEFSGGIDRQKYAVQSMPKSRGFVFNGLDGDGFDAVINPVIVEPVVQFTLYLKVKYEVEQAKAK